MPPRTRSNGTQARKAEALKTGVPVHFAGHDYITQPYRDWDIDVLEAVEDGRIMTALRGILNGPDPETQGTDNERDQWEAFRSRHTKVGELEDFLNVVLEATGGNS